MPVRVNPNLSFSSRLHELAAPIFRLRYGVPEEEKSRLAVTGAIPGAGSVVDEPSARLEERRAAGYLFGRQWPDIAVPVTAAANALRFWEDPEMFNVAVGAASAGTEDIRKQRASDQARALGYAAERR